MPVSLNNTNITFNDSTTQTTAAKVAGFPTAVVFTSTSPGNVWTKPATIKGIKVTVVAGGGGGGGIPAPNAGAGNRGGGGGGTSIVVIPAPAIPGPQPITVGAGGGVGVSGSTSSFGALVTATGGGYIGIGV